MPLRAPSTSFCGLDRIDVVLLDPVQDLDEQVEVRVEVAARALPRPTHQPSANKHGQQHGPGRCVDGSRVLPVGRAAPARRRLRGCRPSRAGTIGPYVPVRSDD